MEGGKLENPGKNTHSEQDENQQQTQPTYGNGVKSKRDKA